MMHASYLILFLSIGVGIVYSSSVVPPVAEACSNLRTCKECESASECVFCGEVNGFDVLGQCVSNPGGLQPNSFVCSEKTEYEYDATCFERDVPQPTPNCDPNPCQLGFFCFARSDGFQCEIDPSYRPCNPDQCAPNERCIELPSGAYGCEPIDYCNPSGLGNPCPPQNSPENVICAPDPNKGQGYVCIRPDPCVDVVCEAGETCAPDFTRNPPYLCETGDPCVDRNPCPALYECVVKDGKASCIDPFKEIKIVNRCFDHTCEKCKADPECVWCNGDRNPLVHLCDGAFRGCPFGETPIEDKECPDTSVSVDDRCSQLQCDECRAFPNQCKFCNLGGDRVCQALDTRCLGSSEALDFDDDVPCEYNCDEINDCDDGLCLAGKQCKCTFGNIFEPGKGCVLEVVEGASPVGPAVGGTVGVLLLVVLVVVVVCFVRKRKEAKERESERAAKRKKEKDKEKDTEMNPYTGNGATNADGSYTVANNAYGGVTYDAYGNAYDAYGNAVNASAYYGDASAAAYYGDGGGTYNGGSYGGSFNAGQYAYGAGSFNGYNQGAGSGYANSAYDGSTWAGDTYVQR